MYTKKKKYAEIDQLNYFHTLYEKCTLECINSYPSGYLKLLGIF